MTHKVAFEALDCTLQDLRSNETPWEDYVFYSAVTLDKYYL